MQDQNYPEIPDSQEEQSNEPSFSDKLAGVFISPSQTFSETAKFLPKFSDWLVPVVLVIVISLFSNYIMMKDPQLKSDIMDKQLDRIEKSLNQSVQQGEISKKKADERFQMIQKRMEDQGAISLIIRYVLGGFVKFIFFFFVAAIFFIIARFILKGRGDYNSALVAYGLPHYILILQIIAIMVYSYVSGAFQTNFSIGTWLGMGHKSFGGFMLAQADPFMIWFYAVVSVGYAKMFQSNNLGKYFGMIFGLWIGFHILLFFLSKVVPFLKFLTV